ncbi:cytochrome c family protein [Commensalibacter papalotli (ex Botero et al. 2024)]|uniref:Cytochrome c2 (Cyc7) (PDB:1YEA) n=1 Tax=Commensalibacter papalotli (ex Botero et al. 2024) TaxID=2972766 RepID=A0ABM9HIS4_9PROT|nr:c-type cytochrome [Commensalibacter papalotli (ex Botero et al. 2024)]CAI3924009.1 Cytochrome c2 (Cyc7) (PDB:1YEA) [Commensalibacter papalotli (ex Botero et al. 2024)]CAI3928096.1 Cytochrome c2 (Cyc7) (PDB:1YEA) [Commensalibacter papalotli (ex Botero et al. 2024)]
MDSFDWNRLAVAGVFSVCVLAAAWGIGSVMIRDTTPFKPAFFIDGDQNEHIDLTSGNVTKGKELAAQQCSLCHTFTKDGPQKIGPNLYDIMGSQIASVPGFYYSTSLKKHDIEYWNAQNLNLWLSRPMNFAPDTIMAYPGVPSTQDRINIIAYLKSISPSAPAIESKTTPTANKQSEPTKDKNPQVVQGKEDFQRNCAVCHTDTQNGNARLGPNLYNIINKPIASQSNYTYSGVLKNKKTNWTESDLDQLIENPQKWAPGSKMIYKGVSSEEVRKNIISYLRSLSPQGNH